MEVVKLTERFKIKKDYIIDTFHNETINLELACRMLNMLQDEIHGFEDLSICEMNERAFVYDEVCEELKKIFKIYTL